MATVLKETTYPRDLGVKMKLKDLPAGRRFIFQGSEDIVCKPLIIEYQSEIMQKYLQPVLGREYIAAVREDSNTPIIFPKDTSIIALDFCPIWIGFQKIKDNFGKVALGGISDSLESIGRARRAKENA